MNDEIHQLGAKFASWAPPVLIEEYEWTRDLANVPYRRAPASGVPDQWIPKWRRELPPTETLEILARLGSHKDMEVAWRKLQQANTAEFRSAVLFLCHMSISFIALYRSDKKRTPKQRRLHFKKIQETAALLNNQMSDSIELKGVKLSKYLSSVDLDKLTHNLMFDALDDARRDDAIANRLPLNEARARQAMDMCVGNISNLLETIASEAERLSSTVGMSKKTAGLEPQINYFIRQLSMLLKDKFGAPMNDVVCAFANAIYQPQIIGIERVEKIRRR